MLGAKHSIAEKANGIHRVLSEVRRPSQLMPFHTDTSYFAKRATRKHSNVLP